MKNIIINFASLIAIIALLLGCVSLSQGDPRIVLEPSVQGGINVRHVNYGETKNGVKTVDVTIENKKSKAFAIKFSIQWFSNGQAYRTLLSEPRSVSMLPNEVVTIHDVAPNVKQDSFCIVISKE